MAAVQNLYSRAMFSARVKVRKKDFGIFLARKQQKYRDRAPLSLCHITYHITHLPTATLSTDQSNRSPGFLNFQLTNTTT